MNEETRFFKKVRKTNSCWIWEGSQSGSRNPKTRYGYFHFYEKNGYAHRFAYAFFKTIIPAGYEIDHLCKNPLCVNPDHLEAVSHAENNARSNSLSALNLRKTHCLRGHEFTPTNIYWAGPRKHKRACLVCKIAHNEKLKAKLRKATRKRQAARSSKNQKPA